MAKSQISLSALFAIAIITLVSSAALAAPQDDVFKRPGEETKKNDTTESQASETAQPKSTAPTSITKESSASIEQQSDGWFTIVDDASMVELRFPGDPSYKEITFSPVAGRPAVVNHLYNTLINKEISVDYSWMELHESPTGKQLNDALDGAVKGAVVNVFGQLDVMTKIKSGKVPGREFSFTFPIQTPDGKTHMLSGKSRIFIKDNRQFQLNVIVPQGKEDDTLTKKLFESFMIRM
ncbi:hypothetical protein [Mariniblastus fucicola]|uniref:Uncharacterized protein n=1 Tax=Mariniblastus fucicola TaxID=980251 RepID=A0A5B9PFG0_9BACT|nr:hypothetical protein [Mariniblastus fucicola]QEG25014.1 hypothetical protein MFFC18_49370 [Mariniblastus fucicola]